MITKISAALHQLFAVSADAAAAESNVIKRRRVFSPLSLAKTFVLGYLNDPASSDEKLAQFAVSCGAPVTPQAIDQRHSPEMVVFLQKLFQKATQILVGSTKPLAPILDRFTSVTIIDSSIITLPDKFKTQYRGGGHRSGDTAALQLQTEWDLRHGVLSHVEIEHGRRCDNASCRQHARRGPGALRISDLGYFDLAVFAAQAGAGEYFLSRLQFGTGVRLGGATDGGDGTAVIGASLMRWLQQEWELQQGRRFIDRSVVLGKAQRLTCRLIAWRMPQEQADRRRAALRKEMQSRKGHEPSAERLAWCDWSILITNVAENVLTPQEATVLYRARWQIELLFKRWKSQGLVEQLSGSTACRQMVRVWARLVAVLVQHGMVVGSIWGDLTKSLTKASEAARCFADRLAAAGGEHELDKVLADFAHVLAKTCRRDKRSEPSTFDLLNSPQRLGFGLT